MGPLKLGSTLSQKYRIVRLLAESGGVVLYEASDLPSQKRVWIKVLQREALANAEVLERFQLETKRAAVLDVGKSESGLPYMVATELAKSNDVRPKPTAKAPPLPAKPKAPASSLLADVQLTPRVVPAPPSSSIPLLAEDVAIEDTEKADEAPTVPRRVPALSPPPVPSEPKVIVEPLPPPPPLPQPRVLTPTLPPTGEDVVRRDQRSDSNAKWATALAVVAMLTGIGGWLLGRMQGARQVPVVQTSLAKSVESTPNAASSEMLVPTRMANATQEPGASAVVSAQTSEPAAATIGAEPTLAIAPATANAPPRPTVTAAVPVAAEAPTAVPARTHLVTPKPPPAAAAVTSDPLTL